MLALPLLAAAMIALTILALLFAGVVAGAITGIVMLNVLVLAIGLRSHRARPIPRPGERWRPKSFRRPPQPPLDPEAEEELDSKSQSLTVHRR